SNASRWSSIISSSHLLQTSQDPSRYQTSNPNQHNRQNDHLSSPENRSQSVSTDKVTGDRTPQNKKQVSVHRDSLSRWSRLVKTAKWPDIMEKAKRLLDNGQVHLEQNL